MTKNKNICQKSNPTLFDELPNPQSRNEQFLSFLTGKSTDLAGLPEPQSRIEMFLNYLCHNRGAGGGGGANPFVGLTNAVINNNIITFQKNDGTTVQVDLNELNTRINNIVPTQGNINLELRQVGDSIRLQAEGQDAGVIDLAGFVKSVNNIAPVVGVNGNITLNAEHMNYDDVNTQLGVRTVQEAIEVLKDNIDLIDTADIHIVANETELNNLLAQGVLKKSDIIYIIDSTGVVDYDNVNVNNGTNPVAMIYDDGVVGNHLRVFSKVAPTINLNASNVAFNSNNVDGVTANNVQTAIEEVNATTRNSYATSTYDAQTGKLTLTKHNGTSNEYDLATGTVKTVNQQPSDGQGNVKVDAEHIEYNNQTSQINATDVQGAIDEVKNLIDLLQAKNTTTHFVADNAEFEQLKNTIGTNFVSGDIVHVINSTDVIDYNGIDVDNDGKAVSLIYDEKVNGFRVLSRDSEKINLKANLVTVEPTINGLNNVQAVLEEFNRKFVSNLSYDATDRSLKQTKDNQESTVVTGLVTQWGDLEHITEFKITNIFNKNLIIDGECYYANGTLSKNDPNWCRYNIPCEANDVISVAKKLHDSEVFTYLSSDGSRINSDGIKAKDVNGWKHYVVTVPNNADIKTVSINIYKPHNLLDDNSVMIYKGDGEPTTEYYPFADNYNVIVDGSKVALTFDPTGSNLTSTTTHDAIKELNTKIANAGGGTVTSVNGIGPVDGNVTINIDNIQNLQTSLASKVDMSLVGNEANKIPVIDGSGKLESSIMPDISITSVTVVKDEAEMMRLPNIQVGDVVVVENGTQHQNQTYMCKDETAITQDDKFIAINIGYPVVKKVNGILPSNTGEITLNGANIDALVGGNTKTVQAHMQTINSDLTTLYSIVTPLRTTVTNNTNKIATLEARVPDVRVGDVITTYANSSADYSINGVTYLYIGRVRAISSAMYPQLATALGLTNVSNFQLPIINDVTHNFDNTRTATRRSFICAGIS